MKTTRMLRLAGLATLIVAAPQAALAQCADPIGVGSLGGGESLAWDINNAGQVVGEALTDDLRSLAYIWDDGVMTGFESIDGQSNSVAWGVNDLGEVVGTSDSASAPRTAMLWSGGVATNLGAAMGALGTSVAWDINNAGQIVGQVSLDGGPFSKAYRWEPGAGLVQVDDKTPYNGTAFIGVNESGVAVGHEFIFLSPDDAMISTPGRSPGEYNAPENLPDIPGPFAFSWANSVNENGVIIGHVNPGTGPWTAVLWTPAAKGPGSPYTMTPLGTLPGFEYSEGEDVNDNGLAVGWVWDAENEMDSHAWAWKDGVLRDLNDFLPANTQWDILLSARGVNNDGDIAGIGRLKTGELQGFVMRGYTGNLPQDFNGDGSVDVRDLLLLLDDFGPCDGCPTDLNCDGVVNGRDVMLFVGHGPRQPRPNPTPRPLPR